MFGKFFFRKALDELPFSNFEQANPLLPRLRIGYIVRQYSPKSERRSSSFGREVDERRRQLLIHSCLRRVQREHQANAWFMRRV